MHTPILTTALALLTVLPSTLAFPYLFTRAGTPFAVTEAQLTAIGPKTKSCSGRGEECTDAKKAAAFISASFKTYEVTSPGVAAGIIATMMMESGEFQYAKNHFPAPGKPGQGTRNMQSPKFNLEYLKSIKALAPQAAAVGTDATKAVALLIKYGDYDFGSAAWFLKTQCKPDVMKGLESGKKEGWTAYCGCIGIPKIEPEREAYWTAAVKALKASG